MKVHNLQVVIHGGSSSLGARKQEWRTTDVAGSQGEESPHQGWNSIGDVIHKVCGHRNEHTEEVPWAVLQPLRRNPFNPRPMTLQSGRHYEVFSLISQSQTLYSKSVKMGEFRRFKSNTSESFLLLCFQSFHSLSFLFFFSFLTSTPC